jgi:mannose-1-phosphate guanylyltransferase / mannose-6-phosphate isomerase
MARRLHPVILCGGSGTRLWPLSRQARPKQFLPLMGEHSLLQQTVERLRGLRECAPPLVLSNQEHRFMVAEQLHELGVHPAAQLLEPVGRSTAPAIAVAALHVQKRDADGILVVLPSDHVIADEEAFRGAVVAAARVADSGHLVTFGIKPAGPNTGYGYIERAEALGGEAGAYRIKRFVEKPEVESARAYIASGRYSWNSGMFVFTARRYLEELQRWQPQVLSAAQEALTAAAHDLDFIRLEKEAFARSPSISIDYAVMEKTDAGAVIEADFGWSDVGSWSTLWDIGKKDAGGNVVHGDTLVKDADNCLLWSDERLLAALGVKDLMVVATDDAVLVADRARAQEVKDLVQALGEGKRSEHLSHTRVYRPWGYYESLDGGEHFQVKRIMVKPGQSLSLQSHEHRAEHWVVVSGTARVTRGEQVYDVHANESTFIPLGMKHRLENATGEPLYLIEVQSGGYLGEDDIVRYDDRYRRD